MTRLLVLLSALVLLVAASVGAAAAQTSSGPPPSAVAQMTPSTPPGKPSGTIGAFLKDNHEAFRTYGLIFGGVAGLIFAFWRARIATKQAEAAAARADAAIDQARAANEQARAANEQARIAQQGQITDRFSTAVEHLGSEQLPVRLGGIYALWRLIKDSPERDVIRVIDILCAFVRHPPHETVRGSDPGASEDGQASTKTAEKEVAINEIRPDVQTVLDLIGTEKAEFRELLPDRYYLDLTGANLMGANLTRADLTGAYLTRANLTGANLRYADLTSARLRDVNFTGADLIGADLSFVNLIGVKLTVANLTEANLTDAYLSDADLAGANLTSANLRCANNLAQDQLDSACISMGGMPPNLPQGLKPPQKVCRPWRR